ncbi:MAG: ComEC/Rec2 family competence protein [Tannerellaceae bacterium]|jgi:competence protein ComEC|nr:ComEC/Rec2 family competence protein [Tannerellaceae bacterium]
MIKEIQKRPFARPLLIWITGIVWQTFVPFRILSFGLLLVPALLLFFPFRLFGKQKPALAYDNRWIWGAVFACLLLFLSVQLTAYHENRPFIPSSSPLQEWAMHTRDRLTAPFDSLKLTDAERSVLATITLGDRSGMPKEIRQQFSVAGVAHILSVSGFHVAIVCGFLLRMLSFLSGYSAGRWIRYLLTLLLLWTFTTISGLAVASVRAAIMLTLYLTGRQLSRTTDGYNTLAASAFCMLVYDPFYLYDVGFQLSYTAVGFILYLQPRLSRLIQVRNPVLKAPWEWLTLTLAAQTGVTFLCLYYFGRFSTVFLFTNLPLTLIATLLIPSALLWILLPAGFPGCAMLQTVVETLTRSMMWIVDAFSHIPGSSLSFRFDFITTFLSYGALFFLFLYNKKRRPRLLLISLSILLLIIVQKIFYLFL